jgi:zinc transport system substrate-binding protein
LATVPGAGAEPPRVVASVAPVHGLVAAVMHGVGEPTLLLDAGASPHHGALKPSQQRALHVAAVVIWVGAPLEAFLERALESLNSGQVLVTLLQAPGIRALPAREGGRLEAHAEGRGPQPKRRHALDWPDATPGSDRRLDPHIWLDPDNARAIVELVARVLSQVDLENAERYRVNAAALDARIRDFDHALARRLAPVRNVPYVVFHDAYQAFEAHYGLRAIASLSVDPARAPGARRLRAVRARIAELGARCVFAEPQFRSRLVATVVEGTGARVAALDPLGVAVAPGPDAWFTLMQELGDSLAGCLSGG